MRGTGDRGARQGRAGHGEVLSGELEQLFFYVKHCMNISIIKPYCFKVPSKYFIGIPSYGLHKSSLRNLSKGCNSKNCQNI